MDFIKQAFEKSKNDKPICKTHNTIKNDTHYYPATLKSNFTMGFAEKGVHVGDFCTY